MAVSGDVHLEDCRGIADGRTSSAGARMPEVFHRTDV
jgi:hypothetical protein